MASFFHFLAMCRESRKLRRFRRLRLGVHNQLNTNGLYSTSPPNPLRFLFEKSSKYATQRNILCNTMGCGQQGETMMLNYAINLIYSFRSL